MRGNFQWVAIVPETKRPHEVAGERGIRWKERVAEDKRPRERRRQHQAGESKQADQKRVNRAKREGFSWVREEGREGKGGEEKRRKDSQVPVPSGARPKTHRRAPGIETTVDLIIRNKIETRLQYEPGSNSSSTGTEIDYFGGWFFVLSSRTIYLKYSISTEY